MQAAGRTPAPSAVDLVETFAKTESLNGRIGVLRQLAIVGREESVPLLAALLDHEDPVIRLYALAAAEANPSTASGAAIVRALGQARDAAWRVAIVNALGSRGEPTAVRPLAGLIDDPDAGVADAAIAALGNVGTVAAGTVLEGRMRPPVATAAARAGILCAEKLRTRGEAEAARRLYRRLHAAAGESWMRMAGLRGLVLLGDDDAVPLLVATLATGTPREQAEAARLSIELPRGDADATLTAALFKLPPTAQGCLLEALAEREAEPRTSNPETGPGRPVAGPGRPNPPTEPNR